MKGLLAGAGATLALLFLLAGGSVEGQDGKPKHTISEVMKKALKGNLTAKVADGKATPAEKAELIELFESLHDSLPPRGSAENWKARTKVLLDTAKSAKDDPQAAMALKKLANCMACHKEHKK